VGCAQKGKKKKWFDEECATVNEKKNFARIRTIEIQNKSRAAKITAMNEYSKHEERKSSCLKRKKGNSTIRFYSKSSDTTVYRYKKAVQTIGSNLSSYERPNF
jgi:hypothetical protein